MKHLRKCKNNKIECRLPTIKGFLVNDLKSSETSKNEQKSVKTLSLNEHNNSVRNIATSTSPNFLAEQTDQQISNHHTNSEEKPSFYELFSKKNKNHYYLNSKAFHEIKFPVVQNHRESHLKNKTNKSVSYCYTSGGLNGAVEEKQKRDRSLNGKKAVLKSGGFMKNKFEGLGEVIKKRIWKIRGSLA